MNTLGWVVIGGLSLLFLIFLFIVIRPLDVEITQDRPIIKFLCELQYDCKAKFLSIIHAMKISVMTGRKNSIDGKDFMGAIILLKGLTSRNEVLEVEPIYQ